MHLWNDYEGKTLAGTFPIETLLRTEGRNACFATHDRAGRPAVLRLTEALNDQQEMRERFEAIQEMGQRNLVAIEDFGDVEFEGTPLIYLVMESTQESLADIVRERRLTIEETGEVASSLSAALEALHAHGLVHGHVEPASVLAAGQVIKLRSDCVRPAPSGAEGARARAEDVFGLADVLNRSLTQQRLEDASDALALPEPYATIVRNVVRGSWGIEEVASEVRRYVRPAILAQPPMQPLEAPAESAPVSNGAPMAIDLVSQPGQSQTRRKAAAVSANGGTQLPLAYADTEEDDSPKDVPAAAQNARGGWRKPDLSHSQRTRTFLMLGAAGLCLILLLAWLFTESGNTGRAGMASATAHVLPPARVTEPAFAAPAATPPTVPTAAASAHPVSVPGAAQKGQVWRVVAYTYNVEAQATAKARMIAERHAELDPQVFSRAGRAPFLVTLGGPLTEQQAATMRERARRQGLARDVYMQNYSR